jgi:hypothetical protein
LEALRPSPRSDRGRCRELTEAQRSLLAAIREEHPSASVPVILRTLVAEGRLEAGAISVSSVRRFYQERVLDRVSLRGGNSGRMLELMVKAVRKHGPPDALYLDNGSTYRGQPPTADERRA